jgi:hypothetical protein
MKTAQQIKQPQVNRPVGDGVTLEQVIGGMLFDRYQAAIYDAPPERILALLQLATPEPEATEDVQDRLRRAFAIWRHSKLSN